MANITPSRDKDVNSDIVWASVTNADTCLESFWPGGKATVEVTGTFNGATVQMQWGSTSGTLSSLDTDEKPDGAKFTSAGAVNIELARGFINASISGGGASQNLKIIVRPLRKTP